MRRKFAFVLTRDFTLSPLAMFVDTLRLAGDERDRSRRVLFDWQIVGERGLPIRSSSGFELMPTAQLRDPAEYDHVVLVGGLLGASKGLGMERERFVAEAARKGIPIAALCTASFHLARLGLLDGRRVCVSHFHLQQFQDEFPNVSAEAVSLFAIDGDRATCAGGAGAADLASHYVQEMVGAQAAQKAANILQLERVRSSGDIQPTGELFAGASNRTVRRALLLMQSKLGEDMEIAEIANKLHISRRQLERLFAAQFGKGPKQVSHAMQVERAKQLLCQTDLALSDIAAQCGFTSPQQFNRTFHRTAGCAPSAFRARK